MRYVIKKDGDFVKWIQWTAGVSPLCRTDVFDKAYVVDDDYLNYIIERTEKTRKELILEKYPEIEILPVQVTLIN